MNNNFIRLLDTVEEIRQMQENREELKEKARGVRGDTLEHVRKSADAYQAKKQQYMDRMSKAEEENQDNEKRLVELTRAQIQAETAREPFTMAEELARLKGEVAAYPQTKEAIQSLIDEIVIPAVELETLEGYRREWQEVSTELKALEEKIQLKLLEVQKNIIPFCMATFEVIPASREFLPQEVAEEWEEMRKEPSNEE